MEDKERTVTIHRVGTITCGFVLIVYDFPAILLVMILAVFAMLMAAVEFAMMQGGVIF